MIARLASDLAALYIRLLQPRQRLRPGDSAVSAAMITQQRQHHGAGERQQRECDKSGNASDAAVQRRG